MIKDIYLLKESPTFELLPGQEANINLVLEKTHSKRKCRKILSVYFNECKRQRIYQLRIQCKCQRKCQCINPCKYLNKCPSIYQSRGHCKCSCIKICY